MFTRVKRPSLVLDLAPLIDVVFLLLVFFMLTSSFVPPSLPLQLPGTQNTETAPPEPITISMDQSGRIAINGTEVTLAEFPERLEAEFALVESRAVAFRGDRGAAYGNFVELMDLARRAGATQLQIVHQPK